MSVPKYFFDNQSVESENPRYTQGTAADSTVLTPSTWSAPTAFPSKPGSTAGSFLPPNTDSYAESTTTSSIFKPHKASAIPTMELADLSWDFTPNGKKDVSQNKRVKRKSNLLTWKRVAVVMLCTTLVIGAAITSFFFLAGEDDENQNNQEDDDDNEVDPPPPPGFCDQFGVTDDEVRLLFANTFETALSDDFVDLDFRNRITTPCFPENLFGKISNVQAVQFRSVVNIFFNQIGVQVIHENAFPASIEIQTVRLIDFQGNQLSELPDFVFSGFTDLDFLRLVENNFVTLNNDIFGANNKMRFLFLESNPQLTDVPEVIQFTPLLEQFRLDNSGNLVNLNPDIFANVLGTLTLFGLINTPLANQGTAALAALTGLAENIIIVTP